MQIGSMEQIRMAVPGATVKPVQIAPANGNGAATEQAGRSRRRRLSFSRFPNPFPQQPR